MGKIAVGFLCGLLACSLAGCDGLSSLIIGEPMQSPNACSAVIASAANDAAGNFDSEGTSSDRSTHAQGAIDGSSVPAPEAIALTEPMPTATEGDYTTLADAAKFEDDSANLPVKVAELSRTRLAAPKVSYSENTPDMQEFAAAFTNFLQQRGIDERNFSFAYQDIRSGERYEYNPEQRYMAASCMKLGMAMACAQLVERGILNWNMLIPCVPDEVDYIYQANELAALGEKCSLRDLLSKALRYSNNSATSVLFHFFKINGRQLHHYIDEATGMHYAADTTMSAREGINLLAGLVQNPNGCTGYRLIINEIHQSTWNNYLTRDLPRNICANKYGEMNGYTNELGIVYTNRPFIYSAFGVGLDAYTFYPALGKFVYDWNLAHQK